MDVQGKIVLITGASAGIGLATARHFAQAGARLALVARTAHLLTRLAEELHAAGYEAIAIPADLRDPAQVQRAIAETVQHFGHIDILINNAGQSAAGTIAELNIADFHHIMDLNVYAPFLAMQTVIPIMREHGGGLIINISSMVSKMSIPGLSSYAATKAALNVLSTTARVELAADNIRVITVFPRITATKFAEHALGNPELRRHQRTQTSAPVDQPEHVAEKILDAAINEPAEQYMDK